MTTIPQKLPQTMQTMQTMIDPTMQRDGNANGKRRLCLLALTRDKSMMDYMCRPSLLGCVAAGRFASSPDRPLMHTTYRRSRSCSR
eukprot:scaffold33188_cov44-Attheya_sp.AAC.1